LCHLGILKLLEN